LAPCPRNKLMDRLHAIGIATRPGTHSLNNLGAYQAIKSKCPIASECAAQTMALPFHNQMELADIQSIVVELKQQSLTVE